MSQVNDVFMGIDWQSMTQFLLRIMSVLLCLTVHETAHGLAAYILGDPTAKSQRRLSLNPLRHMDPFGTLMMLTVGFGWAKPVPVDMRYFKRPKLGMAVTALAGPMSNLILAFIVLVVYMLSYSTLATMGTIGITLLTWLPSLAIMSISLGVFNLIPFPPLDGSKVLESVLPNKIYYTILKYERYGIVLLMLALWSDVLYAPLMSATVAVFDTIYLGAYWIYSLV